jgi:predicted secreted protein
MKQTAVEWLIKELKEKEYLGTFCTADAWEREEQQMRLIIDQAKAMEKQQIVNAFDRGKFWNMSWDGNSYYDKIIIKGNNE